MINLINSKHSLDDLLNKKTNLLQTVCLPLSKQHIDFFRLDLYSPKLSGNKYFKLKYNLLTAQQMGVSHIVSFGGAHSNHLFALANACQHLSIKLTAIIRGEQPVSLSPTLAVLNDQNVDCIFVSRHEYKQKTSVKFLAQLQQSYPDAMIIPEGGSNDLALKGCREIVELIGRYNSGEYTTLAVPCGTVGTFSGLVSALEKNKKLLGFSALKITNENLHNMLSDFISENDIACDYKFYTEFHGGGYAKVNPVLFDFVKQFETINNVPLDYIYVAKMLYGLDCLLVRDELNNDEKIIALHTGGLQGRAAIEQRYKHFLK